MFILRSGRDASNTDPTRSGPSAVSTSWEIHSNCEAFKDTPVEQSWTQNWKITSKIQTSGRHFCIIMDLLMITSLWWKEILSQEDSVIYKEDKLSSLHLLMQLNIPMFTPRLKENETRMSPCRIKWNLKWKEYSVLVRAENHSRQRIKFFWVKKQCEITAQRKSHPKVLTHVTRFWIKIRVRFLKGSPCAAKRAADHHQRSDNQILKITPRIGQRFNGVPKFQIEQDPTRREIIANLVK